MSIKLSLMAAGLVLAANVASAATIDFTDRSKWSTGGALTQNYGGLGVSLTSNPANNINFDQNYFGPTDPGLVRNSDGIGVVDDETTGIDDKATPPLESVTVTFSEAVLVNGLTFTNLFYRANSDGTLNLAQSEKVRFYSTLGGVKSAETVLLPDAASNSLGGYAKFTGFNIIADSITFFTFNSRDADGNVILANSDDGTADYTVAAIEIAPVPLPAAAWMLLSAFVGMVMLRKRRTA